MGTVVAVGEETGVAGFALAGAVLRPAAQAEEVRAVWRSLPAGTSLVILTPAAAEALGDEALECRDPLTVVMPP
ncbi:MULTISPECIES: hypothetical protein [Streptomyces]|uniref:Uncharacterized protein n=1 Tax=Streptomyces morookaense TaxID=1970 RepID=A0A7Y7B053_STRMO|nr:MULTISPECIES: hypothetical protein [Streptomyces]MCC2274403.1 hypothetical protein [Streptomyces sp. ET3-23]NVK76522.1 hypothetical protein [Streptomyces morookaense]GHF07711.1 hypothetical protein GCM10010359_06080 [Streptomyces morookaense]